MTRKQIAIELLNGCPEESLQDHQKIAQAIKSGASMDDILSMPETNNWPETYSWLKGELPTVEAARALSKSKTGNPKAAAASRANGKKGGRPWGLKIVGGALLENDVDFKCIMEGFEIFSDAVSEHGITPDTKITWSKKRLSLEWGDMGSIIASK